MTNQQWQSLTAWEDLVRAAERYVVLSAPTVDNGRIQPLSRRQLLRLAMLLHGVGAADIARTLGVSRQCVTAVIAGKYRTRRVEERLAVALGLPVGFLFGPPGIRGRHRKPDIKVTRQCESVNAELSPPCRHGEDEIERARRLVG